MKEIVILNPKYNSLKCFAESVDSIFPVEGTVIHRGRNIVKTFQYDGIELNVKSYAIPNIFNQFIYRRIRRPKGLRAFLHPGMLRKRGFESPEAVAYVEFRSFWRIGKSYFISIQCPYSRRFYEFGNADEKQYGEPVRAFARYVADLHDNGVYHKDLSPGNILFEKIDGTYRFSLVDTNRMSFSNKPIGIKKGCANMARLWGQKSMFVLLADEYARHRGADAAECRRLVLDARKKFWTAYKTRHKPEFNLDI